MRIMELQIVELSSKRNDQNRLIGLCGRVRFGVYFTVFLLSFFLETWIAESPHALVFSHCIHYLLDSVQSVLSPWLVGAVALGLRWARMEFIVIYLLPGPENPSVCLRLTDPDSFTCETLVTG